MSIRETIKVTGALPAGPFAFAPARAEPAYDDLLWTFYEFNQVTADGTEFNIDEVRVHITGSEFDRCVFRQDLNLAKAHRKNFAYSYSYVLYGMGRSIYRDCTFDHVDFGNAGGGGYPGDAWFEGCTFSRCAFRQFDAREADFINCTFVVTINNARFWGRDPDGQRPNTFSRNDFTRAKLKRFEFLELDLRDSLLPSGLEYRRIDDFLAKAKRARSLIADWSPADREDAEWLLRLYEERWSEPLFRRRDGVAPDSPLWPLLESFAD